MSPRALTPVLRLVGDDGSYGAVLAGWHGLTIGGGEGEPQQLQLDYQTDADTWALLTDQATVVVLLDGVEYPDMRFVLDQSNSDEVTDGEPGTWAGASVLQQLDYGVVYPAQFPSLQVPGEQLASDTPGSALGRLLTACQQRGALVNITPGFTDTVDSAGQPWPETTAEFLDMGTSLLTIVSAWAVRNFAVASMDGDTLNLYAYGNHGADLSNDVILLRGADLGDGPAQVSSRGLVSAMLGTSDEYAVEATDASSLSRYGRREGYVSQSQVPDEATLSSITQATMALSATPHEQWTYGLTLAGRSLPMRDYQRGDVVELRTKPTTRQLRVRQLSLAWDADATCTASVTFGWRFRSPAERLQNRLDQLTGYSLDGGLYNTPNIPSGYDNNAGGAVIDPGDPGGYDIVAPAAPTNLHVSNVYFDADQRGQTTIQATLQWTPPTLDEDGGTLNDFSHYEVYWRDTAWWEGLVEYPERSPFWVEARWSASDEPVRTITLPVAGHTYDFRLRAVDTWGNVSGWAELTATIDPPTAPPDLPPSTPVVAPSLFNTLAVTWDGNQADGAVVDTDIAGAQVHISTTSGFAYDQLTYRTTIPVPAAAATETGLVHDLQAGTIYYVRLVLVDLWGNTGPASTQASGVPQSVTFSGQIGPEDLVFSDYGNLTPGGSFERGEYRDHLTAQGFLDGGAHFTQTVDAAHGDWVLEFDGADGPTQRATLAVVDNPSATVEWFLRAWTRLLGATSPAPTFRLFVDFTDQDGNLVATTGPIVKTGGWAATWDGGYVEGRVSPDADYVRLGTAYVVVDVDNLAIDQRVQVDAVETRQVATNVLIADAAIDTAKVAELSVSKLTAGTMSAAVTVSGQIATSLSGARVELNSSGLKAYDANNTQTVGINSDGSAFFTGQLGNTEVDGYVRALNESAQVVLFPEGWSLEEGSSYLFPGLLTSPGYAFEQDFGFLGEGGKSAQPYGEFRTVLATSLATNQSLPNGARATMELLCKDADYYAPADEFRYPWGQVRFEFPMPAYWMDTYHYGPYGGTGGGTGVITNHWGTFQTYDGTNAAPNARYPGEDISFLGITKTGQQAAICVHTDDPARPGKVWVDFRRAWGSSGSVGEIPDPNGPFPALPNYGYCGTRAETFYVPSDSRGKTALSEPDYAALDVVRANPARRWFRKNPMNGEAIDVPHIGPVADDLPEEVRVTDGETGHAFVSLSDQIGLLWKAIEELAEQREQT